MIEGILRTVIGAVGDERGKPQDVETLSVLEGVEKVVPILQPYKLASRDFKAEDTHFTIGDTLVGSKKIPVIAGPCSVENEEQIMEIAKSVKESGASMLRGGAYKPRTSPYAFQGLGVEGLKLLAKARELTGLPIVTEILDPHDLDAVCRIRRHAPDRRAELTELRPFKTGREIKKTRASEKGHGDDYYGIPDVRRIYTLGRQ